MGVRLLAELPVFRAPQSLPPPFEFKRRRSTFLLKGPHRDDIVKLMRTESEALKEERKMLYEAEKELTVVHDELLNTRAMERVLGF
ncbi:hypothetical protein A1Q1_07934 [Trichosporon asahii var. asahii CBS 2479]|uniref:Uncharacterized protein n=1 Tax=Trichosporon asahii var. asahii (strain ATCC 90039 / CBS 2479 / JCM 2466 / KCTC 7840 / NBRC 103889/ NCYC 2677 / UAMH 7654) TaxID=1186058 RepID=J6F6E6_TRIAS|nr:hypothetical protein A1Q1_07934 [Trichosporon asahii var. asahii CBS 2479]EJT50897.1 hypothetical protein A1Q1_07934 [Trichosporon asahii var. asahii CBS 2479]